MAFMVPLWLKAAAASVTRFLLTGFSRELRRTVAQRRAAAGEAATDDDRIAAVLEETIGALTGRSAEPSWWNGTMATVRQAGIAPDPIFRGQSFNMWLDDPQVRETLRTLVANRIASPSTLALNDVAYDLLAKKYQDLVGEVGRLSRGKVDVIIAVVQAGFQVDLASNPATSALSVQLQANQEVTEAKLDTLTALVGSQASGHPGLAETTSPIALVDLTAVAEALLDAGTPPSIALLFPDASPAALYALESIASRERSLAEIRPQGSESVTSATSTVAELVARPELKHLIVGQPGCGKTHTLWRTARQLLAAGEVVPLYLPAARLSTWADVVSLITSVAPDVSPSALFSDSRVCACIDGWSEFATGEHFGERQKAFMALRRVRVIANGKVVDAGDTAFKPWSLELLAPNQVAQVLMEAHPGEPLPPQPVLELLRLPLLLSLRALAGTGASAVGVLLRQFHDHVARDLPEAFTEALADAVAEASLADDRSFGALPHILKQARRGGASPIQ